MDVLDAEERLVCDHEDSLEGKKVARGAGERVLQADPQKVHHQNIVGTIGEIHNTVPTNVGNTCEIGVVSTLKSERFGAGLVLVVLLTARVEGVGEGGGANPRRAPSTTKRTFSALQNLVQLGLIHELRVLDLCTLKLHRDLLSRCHVGAQENVCEREWSRGGWDGR